MTNRCVITYQPVTSVPCSTCGSPSVGLRSWPDGTYIAWCPQHDVSPQQTRLYIATPTERNHRAR